MRWRLSDPITKRELRRLLERERGIRADLEMQLNVARKEKDHLEHLFKQIRAERKAHA